MTRLEAFKHLESLVLDRINIMESAGTISEQDAQLLTVTIFARELDEYDRRQVTNEIARREDCDRRGVCEYCGRPGSDPECKFPDRHGRAAAIDELRRMRPGQEHESELERHRRLVQ